MFNTKSLANILVFGFTQSLIFGLDQSYCQVQKVYWFIFLLKPLWGKQILATWHLNVPFDCLRCLCNYTRTDYTVYVLPVSLVMEVAASAVLTTSMAGSVAMLLSISSCVIVEKST